MIALLSLAFAAPPRCDAEALARAAGVLPEVDAETLPALAATALAEACRWPAPLGGHLARIPAVAPEQRTLVELELVLAAGDGFERACPGGTRRLAELAAVAPAERRTALHATCRPAFATAEEWSAGTGLLAAPILLAAGLAEAGVDAAIVRAFGRALAGISDRPEDHPVRTFRPLVP